MRDLGGVASSDRNQGEAEGFDAIGFAAAAVPARDSAAYYAFIASDAHGDMTWLATTPERRASPAGLGPEARSVIALGVSYAPARDPRTRLALRDRGAISAYAGGRDYHDLLKQRLRAVSGWLARETGAAVKGFVDPAPVLERAAAAQSRFGWQGKHTNLVSRHFGSWLFLAELFTSLALPPDPPDPPHPARCGSCRACLDVCPTDAFPPPWRLDARRCLSYLTIKHRGPIPRRFRRALGNRVYGCDDCLTACPWNKFAQRRRELAFLHRVELDAPALADFLDLDDAGFSDVFSGSPVKRIGRSRFLRNVLIAVGNSGVASLAAAVMRLTCDPAPLVRGAATWALSRLLPAETFAAARARLLPQERDPETRAEWTPAPGEAL